MSSDARSAGNVFSVDATSIIINASFGATGIGIGNEVSVASRNLNFGEAVSSTIGAVTVTNSTNVKITNETGTNLGENVNYIMTNNTNVGNPEPIVKTTTTVKISQEQKVEVKTRVTAITNKTSVDNKGNVTTENGAKVQRKDGVTLSGSFSVSSDGTKKGTFEASVGKNAKVKATVTGSTNASNSSVEVGVGAEKKAGKTTITTSAGVRINL